MNKSHLESHSKTVSNTASSGTPFTSQKTTSTSFWLSGSLSEIGASKKFSISLVNSGIQKTFLITSLTEL